MIKQFTRTFAALALLCLIPASAQAIDVLIAAKTFPGYNYSGSTAKLRIYAGETFTASDGTIVGGGTTPGQTTGFFTTVNCTVASNVLSCPSVTLKSTTDSTDNRAVTYTVVLFDASGAKRNFFPLSEFFLSHTLGATTTWNDIATSNSAHPRPPAPGFYDAGQVDSRIASALNVGNPATTTTLGRAMMTVAPADPTSPKATGTNDSRIAAATGERVCYAAQMSGADIGAKINACDAALGADKGTIILTGGGAISTQVIISGHHTLRVVSGIYTSTLNGVQIRLKDYSHMVCDSWGPTFTESTGTFGVQSPMTIIAAYYGSGSEPGAANGETNSNGISVKGCHLKGKPEITGLVSIAAGTNTVTSSSPIFTAAMVDPNTRHKISIDGAGAGGARLTRELITVLGPTSATVNLNADTTVVNATARINYLGSAYLALSLGVCHDCEITDNWFEGTHSIGTGIGGGSNYGKYAKNVTVARNKFTNVHFVNIAVTNAVNARVLDNQMSAIGHDGGSASVGIDVEPNIGDRISGLVIDGNIIDTTESVLDVASNTPRVAHSIVVQNGNNIATPGHVFENVVVSNNQIIGTKLSQAGYRHVSGAGVIVREASGVTVKNNYIQSTNTCIGVDFDASGNTIVGNQCNSTGSGSTVALYVSNSNGNRVYGNTMYADALDAFGASTNALNILETGTSSGNIFDANPGAVVSNTVTSTTRPSSTCAANVVCDVSGTGSPEGVVVAAIGSTFRRKNGAPGTLMYFKEANNAGNTGWVAKW